MTLACPNRRWLRFSLRTLLVAVTTLSVWLGRQAWIVHERKLLRSLIEERGGDFTVFEEDPLATSAPAAVATLPPDPSPPPLVRRWIGDQSIDFIHYRAGSLTAGEVRRIKNAFPEAVIHTSS